MSGTKFTPEFIQSQRKIAEKTTKRPWKANRYGQETFDITSKRQVIIHWCGLDSSDTSIVKQRANTRYIAEAANHYPAALDEIERLQGALSEIIKLYQDGRGHLKSASIAREALEVDDVDED
jgi:hypothetical protein